MGRNGHICGAVSGAALIIGMKFGTTDPANFQAKEKAYNKTNELLEKFSAENKSVLCKELIGYDMKNPEELKKAREAGVFAKQCPLYVLSAGKNLRALSVPNKMRIKKKLQKKKNLYNKKKKRPSLGRFLEINNQKFYLSSLSLEIRML